MPRIIERFAVYTDDEREREGFELAEVEARREPDEEGNEPW